MNVKNFNPVIEAAAFESAWLNFKKWFEFYGGKEYFKKQERDQKQSELNLFETKLISSVWKEKHKILNPETLIQLEQCVYLTLLIEWGDDAKCFFDYENSSIVFQNHNHIRKF